MGASRHMNPQETEEKFRKGLEQFNAARFFEAHETWEEIWLAAPQPEKTFLQGIIQMAAAFHHYTRGNRPGAQALLTEGLKKLEQFPPVHRGLALEGLRAVLRQWIQELGAGSDPGPGKWPRIEHGVPG